MFFNKRYSATSGVNSSNLDFLPVQNIEEMDTIIGGVGAVPIGKFVALCSVQRAARHD
jgi:hypothetical protein